MSKRAVRLVDRPIVVPIAQTQLLQSGLDTVISELSAQNEQLFADVPDWQTKRGLSDSLEVLTGHTSKRVQDDEEAVSFSSDDELLVELATRLAEGLVGSFAERLTNAEYLNEAVAQTFSADHSHVALFITRVTAGALSQLSQTGVAVSWEPFSDTLPHNGMFVFPGELEQHHNQVLLYQDRMQRAYDDYFDMIDSLTTQFRREYPDATLTAATRERIRYCAGHMLPASAAQTAVVSGSFGSVLGAALTLRDNTRHEAQLLGELMRNILYRLSPDLVGSIMGTRAEEG